jgi:hypothetical protein
LIAAVGLSSFVVARNQVMETRKERLKIHQQLSDAVEGKTPTS